MFDLGVLAILLAASLTSGFVLWYGLFTVELGLNGFFTSPEATTWKGFCEELSWITPGATKRRADFVRKMIDGWDEGYVGKWRYSEIRDNNLYEEVGWHVLPGYGHFVCVHIILPLTPTIISLGLYSVYCWAQS